nr:hypothetical protein HmN_000677500 [Hymenolepis microstoma]
MEQRHMYLNLLEELRSREVRSFDEAFQKFTPEEITAFNAYMGIQWCDVAKDMIRALNCEREAKERANTHLRDTTRMPCKEEGD